jgi:hypothetical protein
VLNAPVSSCNLDIAKATDRSLGGYAPKSVTAAMTATITDHFGEGRSVCDDRLVRSKRPSHSIIYRSPAAQRMREPKASTLSPVQPAFTRRSEPKASRQSHREIRTKKFSTRLRRKGRA